MRYSGGKGKIAQKLAEVILALPHERIVEPFCGALSMTVALQPALASDVSRPIITLVEAVRSGWKPPEEVSEDTYRECSQRKGEFTDPLVAFVGHCTFGGKWYGGLARGHKRQREPVRAAARTLIKRVGSVPKTKFEWMDYRLMPEQPLGTLIYCDPPYNGTTNGYAVAGFSHHVFWDWVREQSKRLTVVVSEYNAPQDFKSIFDLDCATNVRRLDTDRRVERLFVWSPRCD